jgi:hypothetical protein
MPWLLTSIRYKVIFLENQNTFGKNLGCLVQLFQSVNLASTDTLVSFDIVSLFTKLPVDEALQVINNKLHIEDTLAELFVFQVEAIIKLLEVCVR